MARSLGILTIDMIAKTAAWTAGMSKAERDTEKFKRKFKKDMDSAIATSKLFAAASIATASYFVKATIDQIAAQNDLANQLKTTYAGYAVAARAGDLAGVSAEKLNAASKKLTLSLSKSADETSNEAKALDRLGLSATALMAMPLDKRIQAINEAIESQIPALERAAVAATLYGSKSGAAIAQIDPESIKMAAREIEAFGLNLSAIDVQKIADAEDKMGRFKMAAEGATSQLTVGLTPAMSGISDMFLDASEGSEGFRNEMFLAADLIVNAFGVVGDSIDVIKRSLVIVGSTAAIVGVSMNNFFIRIADGWIRLFDSIPGVDMSEEIKKIEAIEKKARDVVFEMGANISDSLTDDMFSNKLKERIKLAQEAAAEASKANKAVTGDDGGGSNQATAIALTKQETAAKQELTQAQKDLIAEIDAEFKARSDTNERARQVVDGLKSEEQLIRESYDQRRKDILESTIYTEKQKNAIIQELTDKQNAELADKNKGFWEQWLEAAEKNLADFDALSESVINNFSSGFGDAFESIIIDAKSSKEAFKDLAESMIRNIVNAVGQIIAQWIAMKAVGTALKQADAAESVATASATGAGIATAMAPAAAATSLATAGGNAAPATAGIGATIAYTVAALAGIAAISGMAHDGIDKVPETGTWLLKKGERVVTEKTSAKLDKMLTGSKGGGSTVVNVINAPAGTETRKRKGADGREIIDIIIGDMRSDGPISRTMKNTFGVSRQGT